MSGHFPCSGTALADAFREACRVEIQAFKPGNVSVWSEGHDMTVEDFHRSADCSAPHLTDAGRGVGERILAAVKATRSAVGCNTNLGILLLCAPLMAAASLQSSSQDLRARLIQVLKDLQPQDADAVFEAIRHASPGGLGEAGKEDVHSAPTGTLLDAMALARQRDRIAWQYVHDYADIFELGCPTIRDWLTDGQHPCAGIEWAAVACYLRLLASYPDSHIARKYGIETARQVSIRAKEVEKRFKACKNTQDTVELLHQFDSDMKKEGYNPGTCADLTVASLLAFRLDCSTYPHGSSAG